jgi:hypothetical protein
LLLEELMDLGDLRRAADELRELLGEVAGGGLQRPERREVRREVRMPDLEDVYRRAQVLETVLAEIDEGRVRRRHLDECSRRRRREDLAAVPGPTWGGRGD